MNVERIKILLTLAFLFAVSNVYAADENKGAETLSPELRALLQQEMLAIDAGMKAIVDFNAAGDTQQISKVAKQMQASFVLKKNLTPTQRKELHNKLTADFIQQDEAFHYNAGMLAHAAEKNKTELMGFYYGKLFDACASCHQAHAQHRFTHFDIDVKTNLHEH